MWNEVVPFSPVGTQTNTSGYMYWAIYMTSFAVCTTHDDSWLLLTLW